MVMLCGLGDKQRIDVLDALNPPAMLEVFGQNPRLPNDRKRRPKAKHPKRRADGVRQLPTPSVWSRESAEEPAPNGKTRRRSRPTESEASPVDPSYAARRWQTHLGLVR